MLSRVSRPLAIAALVAVASACGADSSVAPVSQHADLTQIFDELSFSDLGLTAAFAGLTDAVPEFPALTPTSCSYASASQSFACPAYKIGGVNVTQSYALLNGAGVPQPAFDPATTAAVRMNTALAGTLPSGGTNAAIDGTQTLTLSGLLTGTHVLDGSSTTHMKDFSDGTSGPVNLTIATTIDKLVLPKSTATLGTSSWPASGTIAVTYSSEYNGFPDSSFSVQLTFSGTSKVAIVFTVDGVTDRCTMDLASANPTCG